MYAQLLSRKEAMEKMTSCSIYGRDLPKVDALVKQKELKNRAEALRICIEYSQAHGVFT